MSASLLVLFACASAETPPLEAPGRHVCEEPRSPVCTRDYRPVCAELRGVETKTYSNGCTACSDSEVVSYVEGACP
ncbi:MAG: hypothetical protein JRG89_17085 [Deltaproteobacteria bacterium]|nr:hypothetical protein [Deltaproteobacteria bacterium]MBW2390124.1 hypothetical protein [Deltaproteobacteria bacterium]MBW2725600.1 hypothetical protein [Deltaproteobacteria bacterium]